MPATSEANLEEKLQVTDVWLPEAKVFRSAKEKAPELSPNFTGVAVKRRDLIDFCTLMAFQSKVGVPLMQALEVAAGDCENTGMKKVLTGLSRHIEAGLLFYEALE